MKKKIADLKLGDVIIINGKLFDVFETPEKLENDEYIFTIVNHKMGDKVKKMPYVTPMDVSYETSSHFKNGEVMVVAKEEIEKMFPGIAEISKAEDKQETCEDIDKSDCFLWRI